MTVEEVHHSDLAGLVDRARAVAGRGGRRMLGIAGSPLTPLKAADEPVVYAPAFRRDIEEPIAGRWPCPPPSPWSSSRATTCLPTAGGGSRGRPLLDEAWFLVPEESVRVERLIARHMAFGRDRTSAEQRSLGSDQTNAELIARTRERADVLVTGC